MKVKCEKLDNQGRGIIYQNNKITFVPNLLPGETAEIEITKNKKNYAEGKIINLITKSNDRITPKCQYENCGCQLKHLTYQKQLEYKQNKVKDILYKYAHITPQINEIIPSEQYNYRNKVTLKVKNKVGYHQNQTNNIIEITSCPLASKKINEIIKILNNKDLSKVKEITIKDFDQTMVIIDGIMDTTNLQTKAEIIYQNDKLIKGTPTTTTKINDLTFKVSKEAFFQVNKEIATKLYNKVIEYAKGKENQKALDLYCGTGTITLQLAQHFKEVIGIEINKEAINCANENKKLNKINNVKFICGNAEKEIENQKADVIVIDPPRSGLTKETINYMLKIKPKKIVYMSCDVITLARDLNILKENYDIKEITVADMFPNTYHVESVSLLKLKETKK